jgi:fatty-acid peroxygenase
VPAETRDGRGVPRLRRVDSTVDLLREGYDFVGNRCRAVGSDAFETRLLLEPAVCLQGAEAARLFYEEDVTRAGAMPSPVFALLQDRGSVAGLDGDRHARRKRLFLDLLGPGRFDGLLAATGREWERALARWTGAGRVVLLPEVSGLLCRGVCAWAGVPLTDAEAGARTRELTAMIEGAGSIGPRHVRGHLLRRRTERWAAGLVRGARDGTVRPPEGSALDVLARHRDADGSLLGVDEASVELLNVLRPTVAVARYVAFLALALHRHPEAADGDPVSVTHEVRRFFPFFPAVAGRVRTPFTWRGHDFPVGRRLVLDLHGTNHDPRLWADPEVFRPDRFTGWQGDPFTLVPQGGGDHAQGHRCAGEWATVALVSQAHRVLTRVMRYDLPPQDLRVRPDRFPARPESGLVVRDVAPR